MAVNTVEFTVSPSELGRVLTKLRSVLQDELNGTVLMASLALAFIVQNPELTVDQLLKATTEASEWLAFYIENMEGIPKEKIN